LSDLSFWAAIRQCGARTTGEVHFGSAESTDRWRDPFPVSGVTAALTDELANPAPNNDQLERNESGLSPESTDGEMNLASAELMETTDLKEICPLVGSASDTAEDYLHRYRKYSSSGNRKCWNFSLWKYSRSKYRKFENSGNRKS